MGQFSWYAQDDGAPIYSTDGYQRTVWMIDNAGNKWREDNCEGYGEFGGKDFFELVAEMNPQIPHDGSSELRAHGIDIYYGDEPFLSPNLYHRERSGWVNCAPDEHGGQGWYEHDEEGWL